MMHMWVVVLAGGRGERLRREVNKVYLPIGGAEMLAYPLDTFGRSPMVDGLVVVVREDDHEHVRALVEGAGDKPTKIVGGGASRHRSEHLGIQALATEIEAGAVDLIAVHDGARPFVSLDLLERVVTEATRRGGAVPVLGVSGPLYRRQQGEAVLLDTHSVRRAQTPQAFRAAELWEGFRLAEESSFEGVDTAETVERFTDLEVGLVPGDPRNIKVTFVEDLLEADELAASFEHGRWKEKSPGW